MLGGIGKQILTEVVSTGIVEIISWCILKVFSSTDLETVLNLAWELSKHPCVAFFIIVFLVNPKPEKIFPKPRTKRKKRIK